MNVRFLRLVMFARRRANTGRDVNGISIIASDVSFLACGVDA